MCTYKVLPVPSGTIIMEVQSRVQAAVKLRTRQQPNRFLYQGKYLYEGVPQAYEKNKQLSRPLDLSPRRSSLYAAAFSRSSPEAGLAAQLVSELVILSLTASNHQRRTIHNCNTAMRVVKKKPEELFGKRDHEYPSDEYEYVVYYEDEYGGIWEYIEDPINPEYSYYTLIIEPPSYTDPFEIPSYTEIYDEDGGYYASVTPLPFDPKASEGLIHVRPVSTSTSDTSISFKQHSTFATSTSGAAVTRVVSRPATATGGEDTQLATVSSTSAPSSSSNGMSGGQIAGAVVGPLLFLALLVFGGVFLLRRRETKRTSRPQMAVSSSNSLLRTQSNMSEGLQPPLPSLTQYPSLPSSRRPAALTSVVSTTNPTYYTGVSTSDTPPRSQTNSEPVYALDAEHVDPPPPYIPPTSPAPPIYRGRSLRVQQPTNAQASQIQLLPEHREDDGRLVSPFADPRDDTRGPFADPRDDDDISVISGPDTPLRGENNDDMSIVSDMSYQRDEPAARR
ncbi:hypothetical protein M501DRAFT_985884 [Patellaria atrata CBS 101060]|uniref:Uncharacterized protein n=1 Tax=Patellaria atrata CBS 101060 TaxID=1346257 RepID=A0A9P4VXG6_9PEZI|nr:hypothetical protein M501DRAFT_985884 [Patellaria atrata CBS 101060]